MGFNVLLSFLFLFASSLKGDASQRYLFQARRNINSIQLNQLVKEFPVDTIYPLWPGSPLLVPPEIRRTFVVVFKSPVPFAVFENKIQGTDIKSVEPDREILLLGDPLYSHQWALNNTGQPHEAIKRNPGCGDDSLIYVSGKPGSDIDAPEAWGLEEKAERETVIIGVVDSGCDSLHPDLEGAIYHNPGEIPNNGIDDDRNGFVDDYWGWDFSGDTASIIPSPDNDPTDQHGHGTHVAGIIAARVNGVGVVGVARYAEILVVKMFPNSSVSVASQAILYAVSQGAKVINISWGSFYSSSILEEVLDFARSKGVIFAAAAGNSGETENPGLLFPANSPLTFAVGASDDKDFRAPFSSYGEELDIVAPGKDILSLRAKGTDMYGEGSCPEPNVHIVNKDWYIASGTSMAAPHVTASIGLLEELSYGFKPDSIEKNLREGADDLLDPNNDGSYMPGWDKYSGFGRLNLFESLKLVPKVRMHIKSPKNGEILWGEIEIRGTASGDDFSGYSISVGEGIRPENWDTIWSSSSPVTNGALGYWDSSEENGIYTLRLEGPPKHEDRVNLYIVNKDIAKIDEPSNFDTVQNYVVFKGTASAVGFTDLYLLLRRTTEEEWDTLSHSYWPVFGDTITTWSIPDTLYGDFELRLRVNGQNDVYEDTVLFYVRRGGVEGWPAHFSGYTSITPRIADLEGDGSIDAVTTSSLGIYAFDKEGTLKEGWPFLTNLDARSIPAIWDINKDGKKEVIFVTSDVEQARVYVLNADGEIIGGWPHTIPPALFLFGNSSPVIADLNNDGVPEILVATLNGVLYAWEPDGSSYIPGNDGIFASATGSIFGQTMPTIIVSDIDGDKSPEVSVSWAHPSWPAGGLWIWRNNATPYSGYYGSFWSFEYVSGMVGGDIDRDGLTDLVIAGAETDTFGVWIIKGDSTVLDGWPKMLDLERKQWLLSPPVIGDLTGDGIPEILVSASSLEEGRIYAWHADGTPLSDPYMTGDGLLVTIPKNIGAPVLADLNGDSLPEIIVRTSPFVGPPEEIWAFDTTGSPMPGWPLRAGGSPFSIWTIKSPSLADIDGDFKPEILLSSYDQGLYAWHTSAGKVIWPTYLHDNANSSLLLGPNLPQVREADMKLHFKLLPPYPNPMHRETFLSFELSRRSRVKISAYNAAGRFVSCIFEGDVAPGSHRLSWNGNGGKNTRLPNGVYFIHYKVNNRQTVYPVILLR